MLAKRAVVQDQNVINGEEAEKPLRKYNIWGWGTIAWKQFRMLKKHRVQDADKDIGFAYPPPLSGCEPCRILEQLFTAFRKVGTESTIVSNSLTKKRNRWEYPQHIWADITYSFGRTSFLVFQMWNRYAILPITHQLDLLNSENYRLFANHVWCILYTFI